MLSELYSGVIYSYGAQYEKSLGIKNENARNVLKSKDFINWYNSHPDYRGYGDKNINNWDNIRTVGVLGYDKL